MSKSLNEMGAKHGTHDSNGEPIAVILDLSQVVEMDFTAATVSILAHMAILRQAKRCKLKNKNVCVCV